MDYDGATSEVKDITIGSPQGSCLSPLLYITLVADLDEWISQGTGVGYADDCSIYYEGNSKEEVQQVLEEAAAEILSFLMCNIISSKSK